MRTTDWIAFEWEHLTGNTKQRVSNKGVETADAFHGNYVSSSIPPPLSIKKPDAASQLPVT